MMNKIVFVSVLAACCMGCTSVSSVQSGSLNVIQTELPEDMVEYRRVSSGTVRYNTTFGMHKNVSRYKSETVQIINFNGMSLKTTSGRGAFWQFLGFLGNSVASTLLLSPVESALVQADVLSGDRPVLFSATFGTLIGGMANEATWRGYHRNNAIGYANSLMIKEGKEMDYFANPSYTIYETPKAFGFGMKYAIDADAIGVRVSEGLFVK